MMNVAFVYIPCSFSVIVMHSVVTFICFFFQAEDGIRDGHVTRVQTCALPIFEGVVTEIANSAQISETGSADQVTNYKVKIRITTPHNLNMTGSEFLVVNVSESPDDAESPDFKPGMSEIGRAHV